MNGWRLHMTPAAFRRGRKVLTATVDATPVGRHYARYTYRRARREGLDGGDARQLVIGGLAISLQRPVTVTTEWTVDGRPLCVTCGYWAATDGDQCEACAISSGRAAA